MSRIETSTDWWKVLDSNLDAIVEMCPEIDVDLYLCVELSETEAVELSHTTLRATYVDPKLGRPPRVEVVHKYGSDRLIAISCFEDTTSPIRWSRR